jgi:hypothetical protein
MCSERDNVTVQVMQWRQRWRHLFVPQGGSTEGVEDEGSAGVHVGHDGVTKVGHW